MLKSEATTVPKRPTGAGAQATPVSPATIDLRWQNMFWREFHIKRLWHRKWDELLSPEYWPPFHHICTWKDQFDLRKQCLRRYRLKPSPPLPQKTSEFVGWRSKEPENSFDLFKTRPSMPPKIRFEKEIYGYYRNLPKKVTPDVKLPSQPLPKLPRRNIVHVVKPLLC